MKMNEKIFISYKSDEYAMAKSIAKRVKRECTDYWMAPESIEGGKSYAQQIPQAIHNCSIVLLVLSKSAMGSVWVAREIDRAINEDKIILPFCIDDTPMTDEFMFYLANVQYYCGYLDFDGEMARMITDVRKYLGIPEKRQESQNLEEPIKQEEAEKKEEPVKQEESVKKEVPVKKEEAVVTQKDKTKGKTIFSLKSGKARWIVLAVVLLLVIIGIVSSVGSNGGNSKFKPNGTYLTITDEKLTKEDILQISKIKKLVTLNIVNCKIETNDLSPINKMKNIAYLSLAGCNLTEEQMNTVSFDGMRLNDLDLSGNHMPTGMLASQVDTLHRRDISNTGLKLDVIAELVNVWELHADNNQIEDLKPLESLQLLRRLSISGNTGIKDLTPLGSLSKLEELAIDYCSFYDLSGLEKCIWLKKLSASGNHTKTLDGLANMTQLKSVRLENNAIDDVSPLLKSKEISILFLADNQIKDINCLKALAGLEYLDVSNNQLTSLDATSWTSLHGLKADCNSMLKDVKLPNAPYKYISLAGCQAELNVYSVINMSQTQLYYTLNLEGNTYSIIGLSNDVSC